VNQIVKKFSIVGELSTQKFASEQKATFGVYYGLAYLSPKARKVAALLVLVQEMGDRTASHNGVTIAMNTVRKAEPVARAMHRIAVTLDSVKYEEVILEAAGSGGKRVFGGMSKYGEMLVLGSGK
jgi:hypothetical protein